MRSPLFFFNDTATTEIYTLSLHDALPISSNSGRSTPGVGRLIMATSARAGLENVVAAESALAEIDGDAGSLRYAGYADRKSTRLNSSHANISYAVFCLTKNTTRTT